MIFERLLDRLIDALKGPKRRDRTVLVILGGYLFIWTLYGVIAKSNQDLHVDMTELIAWSRDLAFGFPKHPPFAAILVRGWFAWFPIDDWTYYLLAILTATTTLWIAWQLFDGLSAAHQTGDRALPSNVHPIFQFPRVEIQREYRPHAVVGGHHILVSAFISNT